MAIADPRDLVADPGHQQGGEGARCYKVMSQRDVAIDALPVALPDDPRPAIDDDALPLPRVGGVVKGMMMGLSYPLPCA